MLLGVHFRECEICSGQHPQEAQPRLFLSAHKAHKGSGLAALRGA
jgi:hypothetical protein